MKTTTVHVKNEDEVPTDTLFTHFKILHSKPNPTRSLKNETSALENEINITKHA